MRVCFEGGGESGGVKGRRWFAALLSRELFELQHLSEAQLSVSLCLTVLGQSASRVCRRHNTSNHRVSQRLQTRFNFQ